MTMSERAVSQRVELRAGELGRVIWRNNVGACYDETGRLIRYGLGNESAELNREYKSADWIGINPVFITPHHVGTVIGQFMGIETKAEGWHLTPGDERGQAQARWAALVRRLGGVAGFASSASDVDRIIRGET